MDWPDGILDYYPCSLLSFTLTANGSRPIVWCLKIDFDWFGKSTCNVSILTFKGEIFMNLSLINRIEWQVFFYACEISSSNKGKLFIVFTEKSGRRTKRILLDLDLFSSKFLRSSSKLNSEPHKKLPHLLLCFQLHLDLPFWCFVSELSRVNSSEFFLKTDNIVPGV